MGLLSIGQVQWIRYLWTWANGIANPTGLAVIEHILMGLLVIALGLDAHGQYHIVNGEKYVSYFSFSFLNGAKNTTYQIGLGWNDQYISQYNTYHPHSIS